MEGRELSIAKLARASWVHVAVAFLAMGAWAFFANRAAGWGALVPALAQGAMSGAITLVLKRSLELLAAGFRAPRPTPCRR
jgi:ABC-type transport system involved in cytochrome c biogenesis permease subunit